MRQLFISILVSILVVAAAIVYLRANPDLLNSTNAPAKESTYARVMRTGTIRCGYTSWNPLFFIDPKTNEKKGIFHDTMEEVGKRLDLKVVWQEELGWGTVTENIKDGRVDMACAGYWLNLGRIKNAASSVPQIFAPVYIWVRQDDTRVFNSPNDLNSDQYTVVKTDGDALTNVIASRFSKTKVLSLPELATNSDIIDNLVSGKADFFIVDTTTMAAYIANNPGKVRILFPNPIDVFPTVMLLPAADPRFKQVIDDTLHDIEYDGTLDTILKNYQMENAYLRNPKPVKLSP